MKNNKLKVYIFCCITSFDVNEMERILHNGTGDEFKVIGLPCSGKVDLLYLIKAFETGADGAVLLTCKEGECRYLEGNLRARKRADSVNELLEEIGINTPLMIVSQFKDGGKESIYKEINDFCLRLRNIPRYKNENINSAVGQSAAGI